MNVIANTAVGCTNTVKQLAFVITTSDPYYCYPYHV